MRLLLTTLFALLALAAPAAAAECADRKLGFSGSAREAEFRGGGGPLGKRSLTVGAPAEGGKLKGGQTYYVPRGKRLKVKVGGYTFRVASRGVFIAQCELFDDGMYFRLLEGRVSVSGPSFSGNARGYVVTPEAGFMPLPGKPAYTVTRTVTNSPKTTRSTVKAARTGKGMFVKGNGPNGRKIPCQAGKSVTVFLDGRYRNG